MTKLLFGMKPLVEVLGPELAREYERAARVYCEHMQAQREAMAQIAQMWGEQSLTTHLRSGRYHMLRGARLHARKY